VRHVSKALLWGWCAGLAAGAMVVGGAAAASAASVSPATPRIANHTVPGPSAPQCSKWQLEQWNLNGNNDVKAVYLGGTFTYSVSFKQKGSCLTGWLTDTYYPGGVTGPIYGTIYGNRISFSFSYPAGSVQGVRTYTGTTNRWGAVSGTWSETGSERGNGTWTLQYRAKPACAWWTHKTYCLVS
jgi:hypothetical protein